MTEAQILDKIFTVTHEGADTAVNGENLSLDVLKLNDYQWNIMKDNQNFHISIHKIDTETKEVTLTINGKRSVVKVRTRMELLLKSLGIDMAVTAKIDVVKAPMPGLIHSIAVTVGQEVEKGEPLLILEAMKMENVIKSPGKGVISKIHVSPKASVEKGAVLLSFA